MDARGRFLAPHAARALADLGFAGMDLGGSTGAYSCALVDAVPSATATVLELPTWWTSAGGWWASVASAAASRSSRATCSHHAHRLRRALLLARVPRLDADSIRRLAANSFAALPQAAGWWTMTCTSTHQDRAAQRGGVLHLDDARDQGKCWSRPELAGSSPPPASPTSPSGPPWPAAAPSWPQTGLIPGSEVGAVPDLPVSGEGGVQRRGTGASR